MARLNLRLGVRHQLGFPRQLLLLLLRATTARQPRLTHENKGPQRARPAHTALRSPRAALRCARSFPPGARGRIRGRIRACMSASSAETLSACRSAASRALRSSAASFSSDRRRSAAALSASDLSCVSSSRRAALPSASA